MLRPALVIAGNDLRRRLRDRSVLIMGVVTPLVMAALIGAAFGGGFQFKATIAVVDADGSALSAGISQGLIDGTPADAPLRFVRVDPAAVRDEIDAGRVDAAIVLPAGYGAAVTGATPPPLQVLVDADKRIAGEVTRSIAEGITAQLRASILAVTTAMADTTTTPDPSRLPDLIERAQGVQLPLTVALVDVQGSYSPVAYFGASMAMLFLFFTVGTGARSLMTERKEGTLVRVRAAPIGDRAVLIGKAIGVLVVGLASLLVVWLVTSVAFQASWGSPAAVLAMIVAVVLAITGISTLVTGAARTDAQADALTSMVAFGFALLGGSFMSPGGLPDVFATLALLTPNGWALRAFTAIGAGGAQLVDVLPAVGALLAIGLATGTVGVVLLQRKVAS